MNKTTKTILVCFGIVGGLLWAMASMQEPRAPRTAPIVHEPVASADDIDFLMHDLEIAREQARAAYEQIRAAENRVSFGKQSLWELP